MTKKKINFYSISDIFRNTVFKSLGVEKIKFEEFYMLGWWIAFCCLVTAISELRRCIGFLSVYTTLLTFILIFLLILLGKISGVKIKEAELRSKDFSNFEREKK